MVLEVSSEIGRVDIDEKLIGNSFQTLYAGLRFSFFIIYFMFQTDVWPVISCVLLLLLLLLCSRENDFVGAIERQQMK